MAFGQRVICRFTTKVLLDVPLPNVYDHLPPMAVGGHSFLQNPTVKLSLQISNQILPATVFWSLNSLTLTYGKNS